MINIPWFLVPHFYLLSVQSYKRLELIAFKVRLSTSKKTCVICLIESPLKLMKNAFYFILKAYFVLKIYKFLSRLFGHVGKTARLRITITSKFMTSRPGLQTIAILVLPNISQSKGNQTMKFRQLIEYNKRNIFLQKSCRT